MRAEIGNQKPEIREPLGSDYTLHILAPGARQSEQGLAGNGQAAPGDVVADFRRFPALLYEVQPDGNCLDVTDSRLEVPDYWAVGREWLAGFTRATGLQDILAVRGHGFWLTLNGIRIVPALSDLGNSFAWIDFMQALARQGMPRSVVVYGPYPAIERLAGQIFAGAPLQVEGQAAARPARRSWNVAKMALLAMRLAMGIVYLLYAWVRRPHVCFFGAPTLLRNQPVGGGRQELRDVYLGEVQAAMRARGWRTTMVEDFDKRSASWPGLRARGFFFPADLLFLIAEPRLGGARFRRPLVRRWRRRWQQIEPRVSALARYRDVDISSLVLPLVRQEFFITAPRVESLVKLWRLVLRLWRPRLLYINYSYGQLGVPVVIAARSLGIETVEQQHGIISQNHMGYILSPNVGQSQAPLCDRMVVWGDFVKRLFIRTGAYPPEQVAVCGFPRMDSLAQGLPTRQETLERLGIPLDAPVVLYASNMIVQELYPAILDSVQQVADESIRWIVKLHPREKTRSAWEKAIAERGLQRRVQVIEDEVSFYALLVACDLHVSYTSTTMIESAVLGKPNLGLDLPHVTDPAGYAAAGAYAPAPPGRLGEVAYAALCDPNHREELRQKQQSFADDWCRHDGGAVECIVKLLEGLLAGKKRGAR